MLVLTRGEGEEIKIGDDITIVVVKVKFNGEVRIGIAAPPEVPVHRGEVYDAIQREQGGPPH